MNKDLKLSETLIKDPTKLNPNTFSADFRLLYLKDYIKLLNSINFL